MNWKAAIDDLIEQRSRIDRAIAALAELDGGGSAVREFSVNEPRRRPAGKKKYARVRCEGCGRGIDPRGLHKHQQACKPKTNGSGLRCDHPGCGETFENARGLGVHKSKTHYGASSLTRSQLGG